MIMFHPHMVSTLTHSFSLTVTMSMISVIVENLGRSLAEKCSPTPNRLSVNAPRFGCPSVAARKSQLKGYKFDSRPMFTRHNCDTLRANQQITQV